MTLTSPQHQVSNQRTNRTRNQITVARKQSSWSRRSSVRAPRWPARTRTRMPWRLANRTHSTDILLPMYLQGEERNANNHRIISMSIRMWTSNKCMWYVDYWHKRLWRQHIDKSHSEWSVPRCVMAWSACIACGLQYMMFDSTAVRVVLI